jgi:hypothetical protein
MVLEVVAGMAALSTLGMIKMDGSVSSVFGYSDRHYQKAVTLLPTHKNFSGYCIAEAMNYLLSSKFALGRAVATTLAVCVGEEYRRLYSPIFYSSIQCLEIFVLVLTSRPRS